MKSPLIASIVFAGILSAPAIAGVIEDDKFKLEVSFDRSALDDPAKIAAEYEDIRSQVSEKCEAENTRFSMLRNMSAIKKCVRFTMNNTIRSIDHEGLASFHRAQKSGRA